MAKSTKGYCKYCGKEYTRTGMSKHLKACKKKIGIYEKATKMVMKEAVYIQNNLNQIQI